MKGIDCYMFPSQSFSMNCVMMGSNNGTMADFETPALLEFSKDETAAKKDRL